MPGSKGRPATHDDGEPLLSAPPLASGSGDLILQEVPAHGSGPPIPRAAATPLLRLELRIRTKSEANQREHWSTTRRRTTSHQRDVLVHLRPLGVPEPPITVTLTRLAPKRLDPDNLAGSFKGVQDGIAKWLRLDDGDPRITWRYEQVRTSSTRILVFTKRGRARMVDDVRVRIEVRQP